MSIIKTINKRNEGNLFHYAHFLCDCLFPEIINGFNKFKIIYRKKNLNQTIGNFNKMYEEITNTKMIEIDINTFETLICTLLVPPKKENLLKIKYVDYFKNYIFSRYNINPNIYNNDYPEVLLIKRGGTIDLLDKSIVNEFLKHEKSKNNNFLSTGKERREINNIYKLEDYLINKYNDKFKAVYFEDLAFEEQIKYFNNAKIIICAHGAVMSNMFFCKSNTKIFEITCGKKWIFFDNLSKILNLNHIKINDNKFDRIKQIIN